MANKNGIIEIHGVQYHTVARRVADWRETYKVTDGWMVATEILDLKPDSHCLVKAQLVDPAGRTIATGHALERIEFLNAGMVDSLVEVAETSAVGRALAFAGFGGGGPIASADEMQRRAMPQLVSPKKLREVVEGIQECLRNEDGPGLIQIQDEWEQEEWIYIWRTMQSWERSAGKVLLKAARDALNQPDPNYIDPAPLENDRAEKEAQRSAAKMETK